MISILGILSICGLVTGGHAFIFGSNTAAEEDVVQSVQLRMPSILPQAEAYVCTSVPLNAESFIVGFEALTEKKNAHHILVFGCEEPGSYDPIWDCGEMSAASDESSRASPCSSNPQILYAWAHNAPKLELPKGVGFRVGGDSDNNYIVMQVHYMHDAPNADDSGVSFTYTNVPVPKLASTMLLVTGGEMAPKSTENFETACLIEEDVTMHPFAFRTHTHRHGVDVSGWIVKENEKGSDSWTLLGRRDPQLPQMFVPVNNSSVVITKGDVVSARCVMKNDEDRVVSMGSTNDDEMCNFYVMYWTEGDNGLRDNTCFSPGAPTYYWSTEAHLNHIPK